MAKLSKADAAKHLRALSLLAKDTLTMDERWDVLESYQEGAVHMNGLAGAFFTPAGLARDLAIEVPGCSRILDLCAGIGTLAFMATMSARMGRGHMPEIVCVEANGDYIAAGCKLLPEATWIHADAFEANDLGHFDVAIANPPFGSIRHGGKPRRYGGPEFELRLIDLASDLADYGVFLVPQMSAPFSYSGKRSFEETPSPRMERFGAETGIVLEPSCGIDTSFYRTDWHGVAPAVEVVCADFIEARRRRAPAQRSLFESAA